LILFLCKWIDGGWNFGTARSILKLNLEIKIFWAFSFGRSQGGFTETTDMLDTCT
jgi:hypothetical protein